VESVLSVALVFGSIGKSASSVFQVIKTRQKAEKPLMWEPADLGIAAGLRNYGRSSDHLLLECVFDVSYR
jgi:hypothetical protein